MRCGRGFEVRLLMWSVALAVGAVVPGCVVGDGSDAELSTAQAPEVMMDGSSWTRIEVDDPRERGATDGPDGQRWVATVWHGSATEGLVQIPHEDEVFGDDDNTTMYDVAVTEWGLIAVGQRVPGRDDPAQMRFIGTVWTSPDGLTWTRLIDTDGTFSGDGHTSLTSITIGQRGLIAIGEVGAGEGSTLGAVWTSP